MYVKTGRFQIYRFLYSNFAIYRREILRYARGMTRGVDYSADFAGAASRSPTNLCKFYFLQNFIDKLSSFLSDKEKSEYNNFQKKKFLLPRNFFSLCQCASNQVLPVPTSAARRTGSISAPSISCTRSAFTSSAQDSCASIISSSCTCIIRRAS